jgi:primosomal protein N'
MAVKLIYCEKCDQMIRSVCTSCGETVSERPCGCGTEDVKEDIVS